MIWEMTHYTAKGIVKFEAYNLNYLDASKCSNRAWGIAIFFSFLFLLVNSPLLTPLTLVHVSSPKWTRPIRTLSFTLSCAVYFGIISYIFLMTSVFSKAVFTKGCGKHPVDFPGTRSYPCIWTSVIGLNRMVFLPLKYFLAKISSDKSCEFFVIHSIWNTLQTRI